MGSTWSIEFPHLEGSDRLWAEACTLIGLIFYVSFGVPIVSVIWLLRFRREYLKARTDFAIGTLTVLGSLAIGALWPLAMLYRFMAWLCEDCNSCCGMRCFGGRGAATSDGRGANAAAEDVEAAKGVAARPKAEEWKAAGSTAGESMELPPYPEACVVERK
ncbi:hypothetical protein B0T14DRAFT_571794 [Immersiella caudata]|uniref:Uncharacterized protein n=1 Tax=Immersiella caudata TaxID=314043 RepID=A0AA39TYM9_9PEZI|nr:hypothetical protein B0T14DRAFT_571794 [Immersiella caudata]